MSHHVVCVLDRYPLPATSGGRIRQWNLIAALAAEATGTVVVQAAPDAHGLAALRVALPGWRVESAPPVVRQRSALRRLRWLTSRHAPLRFAVHDAAPARQATAAAIARGATAVVALTAQAAIAVADVAQAEGVPLVTCLDDLEHVMLQRTLAVRRMLQVIARDVWVHVRDRADKHSWHNIYRELGRRSAAVVVCSEHDREGFVEACGGASAPVSVVPNGAYVPALQQRRASSPPIVLFQGQMTYAPNIDGARFLATEIAPRLRALVPDVRVRIVGRCDESLRDLEACDPSVEVTGFIDDIADELDRASVVLVPLRIGSGTRLKILEAFAHGVPVVSTPVGIEGIDAIDGLHALVRSSADDLADACAQLLQATPRASALRRVMTLDAHELVRDGYDWELIRRQFASLVERTASATVPVRDSRAATAGVSP